MTVISRWLDAARYDEEGRALGPLLRSDSWPQPLEVEARDGLLWPTFGDRPLQGPLVKAASAMLPGFLALAGADDDAYARFARRWGMLGLCGDDLPMQHGSLDPYGSVCVFRPEGVPDDYHGCPERVAAWRTYVDQAITIVTASRSPRPPVGRDPVRLLNDWMEVGRVQLSISREPGSRLHLGSGELFGGLAVSMLSLAMGAERLAMCAGCGRWFSPARRQVVGRLWCSRDACQRAKRAAASRDYRRRHAGARSPASD